ncbi:DUF2326 domain-containing protein [Haliscomenobacter sp.]|uniref:DUF2326 domain-containing protein n=1 Tax=Haliscomenobacter sp. TaxID=2717303 RepID=UPI00359462B8
MRLIKLSANQESFRTIEFNATGLSLILASKKVEDKLKTYNSTGKSLSIALTHFCLGSSNNKAFGENLPDWEFQLQFEINGKEYESLRSTKKQGDIFLNNKKYSLDKFRGFMFDLLFEAPEQDGHISFRSLISRFIRPGKFAYNDATIYIRKEQDPVRQLNNAYLLGLDTKLISDKLRFRKELKEAKDFKKQLEGNPDFKAFLEKQPVRLNPDIKIKSLKDEIERLQKSLQSFVIAEDYNSLKLEADKKTREIAERINEVVRFKNVIANIENTLLLKKDIPVEKVLKMYDEAQIEIPDLIKRTAQEAEQFHLKILSDRTSRLIKEKHKFEGLVAAENEKIDLLDRERSELLQFLKGRGALEEYLDLTRRLTDATQQLEKFEFFKEFTTKQKNRINEIEIALKDGNIQANNYLTEKEALLEDNIALFQSIVRDCYDDKTAGINVTNNEGDNQIRFNIDPYIDTGGSGGGVDKVEIFCYDWMILLAQHHHQVKAIWHDSLIFEGVDTRQKSTLLKFALEQSEQKGLQYIIALNQNEFEDIQNQFPEIAERLHQKCVLELTDESDEMKLLGQQVLMEYDKG